MSDERLPLEGWTEPRLRNNADAKTATITLYHIEQDGGTTWNDPTYDGAIVWENVPHHSMHHIIMGIAEIKARKMTMEELIQKMSVLGYDADILGTQAF